MKVISVAHKSLDETEWINRIENEVIPIFPSNIRRLFSSIPRQKLKFLEEIKLRKGRFLFLKYVHEDSIMSNDFTISDDWAKGYRVTAEDLSNCLQAISNSSIYALEEEFKRGFITIPGGHRVGVVGKAILEKGSVKTQRDFSSLNIRIAREVKGVAEKVLPYLLNKGTSRFPNVIIVSPPGCGKTTLLRDLVRLLSNGVPGLNYKGVDIGVVDERSEIAACYRGMPQNDVGMRTDVLDGCPKAEGMIMLVRSMNPKIIATDEVGSLEDVEAVNEVLNSGVSLITTVHGSKLEELRNRPALSLIANEKNRCKYVVMSKKRGVGTVEGIYESINGVNLLKTPILGVGGANVN
ncbi:stage III sporulation protein AA [Desulfitispora alkaliphila]|uniref:stage III sporulation protein AA n=1 Tax=Desulfitispora alkaliphila TaxID=622674 RepID=UPI003D1E4E7A